VCVSMCVCMRVSAYGCVCVIWGGQGASILIGCCCVQFLLILFILSCLCSCFFLGGGMGQKEREDRVRSPAACTSLLPPFQPMSSMSSSTKIAVVVKIGNNT